MADAKQEMNNGTSQSRSVLAKPRLGTFGSSGSGSNAFGSILRPSQLKPSNNPFLKVTETEKTTKDSDNVSDKPSADERLKENKEDAPKFVPLGGTSTAPRSSSQVTMPAQPASGATGFVFGQNLSERVVIQDNINNGDAGPSKHSMSNGTSELLFSNAAAFVKENNQEEAGNSDSGSGGEGLAAAAAEYERARARPPPPAAAATATGEEGEINVLQITCRLFAWEAGSWRERGRGVLRLNDAAGGGGARLVARVAGSLRVVLNTKLWARMVAERAGGRSLRITAADGDQVKLFLVMGNPGDIVQLHRALSTRIAACKRAQASRPAAEAGAVEGYAPVDCADNDNEHEHEHADREHEREEREREHEHAARLQAPRADDGSAEPSADAASPEHHAMKRKEPAEDETSPKRQCPKIVIE